MPKFLLSGERYIILYAKSNDYYSLDMTDLTSVY